AIPLGLFLGAIAVVYFFGHQLQPFPGWIRGVLLPFMVGILLVLGRKPRKYDLTIGTVFALMAFIPGYFFDYSTPIAPRYNFVYYDTISGFYILLICWCYIVLGRSYGFILGLRQVIQD